MMTDEEIVSSVCDYLDDENRREDVRCVLASVKAGIRLPERCYHCQYCARNRLLQYECRHHSPPWPIIDRLDVCGDFFDGPILDKILAKLD